MADEHDGTTDDLDDIWGETDADTEEEDTNVEDASSDSEEDDESTDGKSTELESDKKPNKKQSDESDDESPEELAERKFREKQEAEDRERLKAEAERLRKEEEERKQKEDDTEATSFEFSDEVLNELIEEIGDEKTKTFGYDEDGNLEERESTLKEIAQKYPDMAKLSAKLAERMVERMVGKKFDGLNQELSTVKMTVEEQRQEEARASFIVSIEEGTKHKDAGEILTGAELADVIDWAKGKSEAIQALGVSPVLEDAELFLDIYKREHPDKYPDFKPGSTGSSSSARSRQQASRDSRRAIGRASVRTQGSGGSGSRVDDDDLDAAWDEDDV